MNEIRLNELLNKIYYEYLDSHEAEEFIIYFKRLKQDKDNLQSKIDKSIEYIEKYLEDHIIEDQPDEQSIFYDEKGRYIPNAKEQLLSILKEDK